MSSEISLSKGFTLYSEFGIKTEKKSPSQTEGREGGLPIPFPSYHFFPNPTNQCPDPTDMLTKHQSHSHFGFFF